MKVDKLSISLPADLGDSLRAAASEDGVPLSSWVSEAVSDRLRARALREFIRSFEAEHGELTDAEIEAARERMGYVREQQEQHEHVTR